MTVQEIYDGSNGSETTALYRELEGLGPIGIIAKNLFRAQKASYRAKKYGLTKYRGMSYERKNESVQNLCSALAVHGKDLAITWGWKRDPNNLFHPWVLYVELPQGQVSFHSEKRGGGPEYESGWDGMRASAARIIDFCESVRMAAVAG